MRAVIFANGYLNQPSRVRSLLNPDDLLIAADGGAAQMQALNLLPKAAIGDFDSLDPASLKALEIAGVEILVFPSKKDLTDLELALQYAQSQGIKDILILGALGNRWDQTLANLLLPAASAYEDLYIRLLDGNQELTLIQAGQTLRLEGQAGDTLSLIPLAGDATGITTQGLKYPLNGEPLSFGNTRGVSNVLLGDSASITLEKGMLLCVLIHAGK
jgi:thiamine pyrophosphokinase